MCMYTCIVDSLGCQTCPGYVLTMRESHDSKQSCPLVLISMHPTYLSFAAIKINYYFSIKRILISYRRDKIIGFPSTKEIEIRRLRTSCRTIAPLVCKDVDHLKEFVLFVGKSKNLLRVEKLQISSF